MRKVFLDTETTGFAPGQIAQLSMIIEEENGGVSAKNYFFNIDYITSGAEELCGRGVEFYKEASRGKKFADYKDEIFSILTNSILIAHNLNFDENFISTEFWRQGIMFKPSERLDTMTYFRDICNILGKTGRVKNPKLDELIGYYNIDRDKIMAYANSLFKETEYVNAGLHDARFDTTALFVIFHVYKNELDGTKDWKDTFCK